MRREGGGWRERENGGEGGRREEGEGRRERLVPMATQMQAALSTYEIPTAPPLSVKV
jgi:hypothetical protein